MVVRGNNGPVTDVDFFTIHVIRRTTEQPEHYVLSNGTLIKERSFDFAADIFHIKHPLTGRKVVVHLIAAHSNFYL